MSIFLVESDIHSGQRENSSYHRKSDGIRQDPGGHVIKVAHEPAC